MPYEHMHMQREDACTSDAIAVEPKSRLNVCVYAIATHAVATHSSKRYYYYYADRGQ